jgi:hypothetical protein
MTRKKRSPPSEPYSKNENDPPGSKAQLPRPPARRRTPMTEHEALAFIAALSRREAFLRPSEADELMDEMSVSEELREIVVADVAGGQYQCSDCFPDGCGESAEEHNATGSEISLPLGQQLPSVWAGFVPRERYARNVWDQPVSRIALIHEIAKAQGQEG